MTIIIQETSDYSKFENYQSNRNIVKTKALENSMARYGFLSAFPLFITKEPGNKLRIKDGHHRFYVARKLNIPVKYIIQNEDITISELAGTVNYWSMIDHLEHFVREGNLEYIKVKRFCEETGIAVNPAVSMLGGESAGSGNFGHVFKFGLFRIKTNCDHASKVKDLVLYIKKYGFKFGNSSPLVIALSKISWLPEFNPLQLKVKIKKHTYLFTHQATIGQYLDMIEHIYNYASKSKMPLKFLAEEAAKKRNVTNFNNTK